MITLATYGVGMLIGFWVAGQVTDYFVVAGGHDWQSIWLFPAGFALLVLVGFVFTFRGQQAIAAPSKA